jgi:hypothetical protein
LNKLKIRRKNLSITLSKTILKINTKRTLKTIVYFEKLSSKEPVILLDLFKEIILTDIFILTLEKAIYNLNL